MLPVVIAASEDLDFAEPMITYPGRNRERLQSIMSLASCTV